MAFFPRNLYTPEASFTPLFRLLDDFDSYSRQGGCGSKQGRRSGLTHWQPKFDVREVDEAYELHGELPGISKDDVQIEFTEPQTMVVRGRVERTYHEGTKATDQLPDTTMSDTMTESEELKAQNSHQATVEDEAESEAHESGFEEISKPDDEVTEKPVQATEKPVQATEKPAQEKKQPADKAKYWLTERSIGGFSRAFRFPSRVDQDMVSASFNNGILSINVPKAKKHEARRITVN